jgi:hypothetical protein
VASGGAVGHGLLVLLLVGEHINRWLHVMKLFILLLWDWRNICTEARVDIKSGTTFVDFQHPIPLGTSKIGAAFLSRTREAHPDDQKSCVLEP